MEGEPAVEYRRPQAEMIVCVLLLFHPEDVRDPGGARGSEMHPQPSLRRLFFYRHGTSVEADPLQSYLEGNGAST